MKLKEAIARLLVITMCLSLFSSCVLAVETDIPDDVSIADQSCNDDPLGEHDVSDVVPLVVEDSSQDTTESIQEAEPLAEEDVSDETEALSDTDSPGQEYLNEKKIVARMGQGDDTGLLETMAIGQDTFNNKLNELRSKYPDYSTWTESYSGGSECWGFARFVADYVFEGSWRNWQQVYSIADVKAGDILQYGNTNGYGHTVFVTSVSGNKITFVDCNGNGNYSNGREVRYCGVKWDNTVEKGAMLFGRYNFSYLLSSPGYSESENYGGKCGDNVKWSLDVSTKTLIISGTGDMESWNWKWIPELDEKESEAPWYPLHDNIKTVIIQPDVTSIGTCAFAKCTQLEKVTIPDTVKRIEYCAFYHCEKLKELQLPKNLKEIGETVFSGCKNLETVSLPAKITYLDNALFSDCIKLKKVDIPKSVKWIGEGSFTGCSSLKNVTIPDSVTSIGGSAFCCCKSLKKLKIPKSVTYIGECALGYNHNNNSLKKNKAFLICGYTGSDAEEYAIENNLKFHSIGRVSSPPKTVITNVRALTGKRVVVKWKTRSKCSGYQLQYSTDKKFKKSVGSVTISDIDADRKTVKKLKKGKTYYFRVRTFKGSLKSTWSTVKRARVI